MPLFRRLTTTQVPEGTNLYYTDGRVIAAPLTGYAAGAGAITAGDSVLTALQKLGALGTQVGQKTCAEFFDDFDGAATGNGWSSRNSGTASAGIAQGTVTSTGEYGVTVIQRGTIATGFGMLERGISSLALGAGRFQYLLRFRVPALSTSAQEFLCSLGLDDNITASGDTDCVRFIYDRANHGDFWCVETRSNGVATTTVLDGSAGNLTKTLTANQWYWLYADINAAGTNVDFYIDGVLVKSHTTNIPTGSARATGANMYLLGSVGVANRAMHVDAWYHRLDFAAPR